MEKLILLVLLDFIVVFEWIKCDEILQILFISHYLSERVIKAGVVQVDEEPN